MVRLLIVVFCAPGFASTHSTSSVSRHGHRYPRPFTHRHLPVNISQKCRRLGLLCPHGQGHQSALLPWKGALHGQRSRHAISGSSLETRTHRLSHPSMQSSPTHTPAKNHATCVNSLSIHGYPSTLSSGRAKPHNEQHAICVNYRTNL